MIPILILAAGQSSRMRGRDKLLEDVGGEPLLRRQALAALSLGGEVFVAVAPGQHARTEVLRNLACRVLVVPDAIEGMSGTLRGAVAQLPNCDAFMVLLADLVALTSEDLQTVFQAYVTQPDNLIWRGATASGGRGHPVIYSTALRPLFAELKGDVGGQSIIRAHVGETCLVHLPDDRARLDLDTPEDWAAWRASRC